MLRKNPNNWIANLAMGEYYIKSKNQEKATYHFGKAYEFAGERSKPYARYMYLSNTLILDRM
jgi:cytochrome c-type biogenesis protein CcmH/NrfG